jgi:small subunit ribosomal protein S19
MIKKKINKYERLRILRLKKKYLDIRLLGSIAKHNMDSKNIIKIQSRSSTIFPCFNKLTVHIHNGRDYLPFVITSDYIGNKFGELVKTRKFIAHKKQGKRLSFSKKLKSSKKAFENTREMSSLMQNLVKKMNYIEEPEEMDYIDIEEY